MIDNIISSSSKYLARPILVYLDSERKKIELTEQLLRSARNEKVEIEALKADAKKEIERYQRIGMQPTNEAEFWLDCVDELLEYYGRKIQTRFDDRRILLGSFSPNFWLRRKLSKRCMKFIAEANKLKPRRDSIRSLVDKFTVVRHVKRDSVAKPVGMEAMLEKLKELVTNDKVGIIGIHGMGGIGKTELLSQFHNSFLASETDHHDVVIWLEIGTNFRVDQIQRAIGTRLVLEWNFEILSEQEKRDMLFNVLRTLNFVIILDDLQKSLDLRRVGIPIPEPESKSMIILTTRSEELCDWMGADQKMKMSLLTTDESMQLFRFNFGKNCENNLEKILDNCNGLPLAIIKVAHIFKSKSNLEWRQTYDVFINCPYQLQGLMKNVLEPLKTSYDDLSNDEKKACLPFCLFPTNYKLAPKVIQYYLKFDPDINIIRDNSDEVHGLLGTLRTSSLIESCGDYYSMHPMIRAMVLWTANCNHNHEDKKLVRVVTKWEGTLKDDEWRATQRIAIHSRGLSTLPKSPNCPDLVLLKLRSCVDLKSIPYNFFTSMLSLVLLDLVGTRIQKLPEQINKLANLEYLGLDKTWITSLPTKLGELAKLRYLGMNHTPYLNGIPDSMFTCLARLEYLLMRDSYRNWKVSSEGVGINIEELEKLVCLKELHITVESVQTIKKLSRNKRLNDLLSIYLHVRGCHGQESMELKLPSRNGTIKISESRDLKKVIVTKSTERIILMNLGNLETINVIQASKLVRLTAVQCSKIQQLFNLDDKENHLNKIRLPNLKVLIIQELSMLNSLSKDACVFDSLETLEVSQCPNLKKLNLVAERLKEIKCERSWWDQLQWGDATIKSSFESMLNLVQNN